MTTFINVAGAIAVGKSTLARALSKESDAFYQDETVEGHPTLASFYQALKQFQQIPINTHQVKCHYESLRTQIFFLWDRFHKHIEALTANKTIISDRSIYEDYIFAKVLTDRGEMDKVDFEEIYVPHYEKIVAFLKPPTITIILMASTGTLMNRLRDRNRCIEDSIPFEYMDALNKAYSEWAESYPHRKIMIDTDRKKFYDEDKKEYTDDYYILKNELHNGGIKI